MLLRIEYTHRPAVTITRLSPGRMACLSTSQMNGSGDPELARQAVTKVLKVGGQDALMDVDAKLDLERVQGSRVGTSEHSQHRARLVPWHHPGDDEVDGQRGPKRHQEQADSPREV